MRSTATSPPGRHLWRPHRHRLPSAPLPGGPRAYVFVAPFTDPPGAARPTRHGQQRQTRGHLGHRPTRHRVIVTPIPPAITVVKTANPTRSEPGGAGGLHRAGHQHRPASVTLTSLVDNVYGNLAGQGTCATAVGTVLPRAPVPGNSYTCTFTAPVPRPAAAAASTDVVTAIGTDTDGQTATASDDATVTIVGVNPSSPVTRTPAR